MKRKMLILIIIVLTYATVQIGLATEPTPVPTPTLPTTPTPGPIATVTDSADSAISGLAGSKVLSISLANLDPNPPIAGEIVDVRIGIENLGGSTINNLMIEIIPEYPFDLVPGENTVKNVGIIEGYKVDSTANLKIIKYKMKINKDTPAGNYELKVKYYELGSKDATMKSLYIDVKSRSNAEVIHIDKTTLIPGNQSSLKFRINNVGNSPLRDITFNWENKDNAILPVGSDNTKYIKYIDINESVDLEYQVIADTNAKAGLYKLNLYMTYIDDINGTVKQLSTIAGVYVGGGTDFDIIFSENTNGETSFSIANTGSNPAYAVLVIIPEQRQRNWRISGSNSVMIGNLNSGDYTTASFKLQSKNMASNSSSEIVMQITYTDTMGKRKVIDKEVELGLQNIVTTEENTRQGQQGSTNYIMYIIYGLIIIFLVSAYRKYGKQKLLDPDLEIWDVLLRRKKKKMDKEI